VAESLISNLGYVLFRALADLPLYYGSVPKSFGAMFYTNPTFESLVTFSNPSTEMKLSIPVQYTDLLLHRCVSDSVHCNKSKPY
jgi:hypothetical protein